MTNFEIYKRDFTKKAQLNGFSSISIEKCLNYSKKLIENNIPVIYDSTNFSGLVGYNTKYIRRSIVSTTYFYRYFEIKKKNGKIRKLAEPLPSLKEIQKWILNEILYNVKVSKHAKGYIPKRGLFEHLKYHKNEEIVLTLDIDNFFTNIKFDLVFKVFSNLGYSNNVSYILSKLCTLDNALPQGAPTSPYISNIILYDFDNCISAYCKKNNIKYTRYADDLAFSGNFESKELIELIKENLKNLNLKINRDKTQLMKKNTQQIVSGVVVNEKIQIPKTIRNKIRNEMFYINKFGIKSHLEKINEHRENYVLHLLGKINYLLYLNPKDEEFIRYKQILHKLK